MSSKSSADKLLFTQRGQAWFKQIDQSDKSCVEAMIRNLTLVSHNEFERGLVKIIFDAASNFGHPIALFAIREIESGVSFFEEARSENPNAIDALSRGNDHGSEARVAALIRNICAANPEIFLNHPSKPEMKSKKCRSILMLDDFIGSGSRAYKFLNSFWHDRTIKSWHSFGLIKFGIISYSGTINGIAVVERHKSRPKTIIYRHCPIVRDLPWPPSQKAQFYEICKKYGRLSHTRWTMWWGYKETMCMLIFEHGCPNNVPSFLWGSIATSVENWLPLFPKRAIGPDEQSIFPNEIVRNDPISLLVEVGQPRLAQTNRFISGSEAAQNVLLLLALIAKGRRRMPQLSYATGLNVESCESLVQKCINWGFITITLRLTKLGLLELKAARRNRNDTAPIDDVGSDYYYPKQLRGTTFN